MRGGRGLFSRVATAAGAMASSVGNTFATIAAERRDTARRKDRADALKAKRRKEDRERERNARASRRIAFARFRAHWRTKRNAAVSATVHMFYLENAVAKRERRKAKRLSDVQCGGYHYYAGGV